MFYFLIQIMITQICSFCGHLSSCTLIARYFYSNNSFKKMLTDYHRPGECLQVHPWQNASISIFTLRGITYGHFAKYVHIYSHWNYSPLGLLHKYQSEMRSSLGRNFMSNTISFKALPTWHYICFEYGFGLHTLENHIAYSQMPICPNPITQLNISFSKGKEILCSIYITYNYKINNLKYILNRQNLEILLTNFLIALNHVIIGHFRR